MDSYGVLDLGSSLLSIPGLITYVMLTIAIIVAGIGITKDLAKEWYGFVLLLVSLSFFNMVWSFLQLWFWVAA